jgi:hypothetical protein
VSFLGVIRGAELEKNGSAFGWDSKSGPIRLWEGSLFQMSKKIVCDDISVPYELFVPHALRSSNCAGSTTFHNEKVVHRALRDFTKEI